MFILAVTKKNKIVVIDKEKFEANKNKLCYINAFNSKGEAFRFSLENL